MSFALAFAASLYLAVAVYVFGSRKPEYDHRKHTISELGESGSIYCQVVSYGVFVPVAVLLFGVACLSVSTDPPHALLALSISVGYMVAAIFPCDPGSPVVGSLKQAIHNTGAAVEYLGGAVSLIWISESSGGAYQLAGAMVLAAVLVLSFESPIRGITQRLAETILFAGLCYAVWTP